MLICFSIILSYFLSHYFVSYLLKLTSVTEKTSALKERIRIRTLGFGWGDCHHPWSHAGVDYTPEELVKHLKEEIIRKHKSRVVSKKPKVKAPTRKVLRVIGTLNNDVIVMDADKAKQELHILNEAEKMLLTLEDEWCKIFQEVLRPKLKDLLGNRIKYLFSYTEPTGEDLLVWAKGEVIALPELIKSRKKKRKSNSNSKEADEPQEDNRAIVMWDERYLSKDEDGNVEDNPQLMTLLKTKYNKHVEKAWRCILGND